MLYFHGTTYDAKDFFKKGICLTKFKKTAQSWGKQRAEERGCKKYYVYTFELSELEIDKKCIEYKAFDGEWTRTKNKLTNYTSRKTKYLINKKN